MLNTKTAWDIMCINGNTNGTEFEQATTMLIDLNTNLNANVTYGITVGLELYTIDLTYTESIDTNIKMQSKLLINTALNVL